MPSGSAYDFDLVPRLIRDDELTSTSSCDGWLLAGISICLVGDRSAGAF